MEQKLICVHEKSIEIEKLLKAGWKVVDISAAGRGLETCCWVLLERSKSSV